MLPEYKYVPTAYFSVPEPWLPHAATPRTHNKIDLTMTKPPGP
jgi:hypothetical protein